MPAFLTLIRQIRNTGVWDAALWQHISTWRERKESFSHFQGYHKMMWRCGWICTKTPRVSNRHTAWEDQEFCLQLLWQRNNSDSIWSSGKCILCLQGKSPSSTGKRNAVCSWGRSNRTLVSIHPLHARSGELNIKEELNFLPMLCLSARVQSLEQVSGFGPVASAIQEPLGLWTRANLP